MRLVVFLLIGLAFAAMELFIGGARLLYSIPGVCLIAFASMLAAFPGFSPSPKASRIGLASAALFAGYILARNRLSEFDHLGRQQFFIMAGCLLVYLLFGLLITKPSERKAFFHLLLALAVVQVAVGVYQFKESNQWMPLPWAQRRDDWWRASGLFISPNHFAGYLEVVGLFGIALAAWGKYRTKYRMLVGYASACCLAGVAISGSRGGYLSTLAGLAALVGLSLAAVRRLRPERHRLIAGLALSGAVALVGGMLGLMFLNPSLRERVLQVNDPENMRWMLWGSALEQFSIAPAFGTGAFSFFYYGRMFRDPRVQNDPIHVHNDYLQLLADYGVVGAGLFALLLGAHLFAGWSGFRQVLGRAEGEGKRRSDRLGLVIGAWSALAAYLVHSFFDFNMHLPVNAFLLAAVFGLLANANCSRGSSRSRAPLLLALARWALPPLGLAALVYGLPMVPGEFYSEKARVALRDDRPVEALEAAKEGLRYEKNNPELFFYAGEAARESAILHPERSAVHLQESLVAFTAAFELFPQDSRLALKLAQAHANLGDYVEAANTIALAEEIDPQSSFVWAYKGIVELTSGYTDDAETAFQEAVALGGEGADLARKGLDLVAKIRAETEKTPANSPEIEAVLRALSESLGEIAPAPPELIPPAADNPPTLPPGNVQPVEIR